MNDRELQDVYVALRRVWSWVWPSKNDRKLREILRVYRSMRP